MRRRLSLHVILVVTAAALALVLTVGKRVHEGVSGVAFSTPSAWAAPGTAAVPRHDLSELKAFHLTLIRIKEATSIRRASIPRRCCTRPSTRCSSTSPRCWSSPMRPPIA
jgi:hypothetical protein